MNKTTENISAKIYKNALYRAFFVISLLIISPTAQTEMISVMTWNMAWLSMKSDKAQSKRSYSDYREMQGITDTISPDFMAFQEVDSEQALLKIVPRQDYRILMSDRVLKLKNNKLSQQFTGWAIKKSWHIIDHPDYSLISTNLIKKSRLRYGTHVEVFKNNVKPIHLLSIHLKSGCFNRAKLKRKSCKILNEQIDPRFRRCF